MEYWIHLLSFAALLVIYYSKGFLLSFVFRKFFVLTSAEKFMFGAFVFLIIHFLFQIYSGLSFKTNSVVLLLLSCFSVGFAVFKSLKTIKLYSRSKSFKDHFINTTNLAYTSIFIWVILSLNVYLVGYQPKHWDEFTYWLLMPKQILSFNSAVPSALPFTQFVHYPPGLAASAMWLPSLLKTTFAASWVLLYYLSFTCVFLFYLIETIRKKLNFNQVYLSSISIQLLLFLFCFLLFENVYPLNALVESVQCLVVGLIGLFIYNTFDDTEPKSKSSKFFLFYTLACIVTYLIKPSTVSSVMMFLYIILFSNYLNVSCFKNKIWFIFLGLLPLLAFIYSWNQVTAHLFKIGLFLPQNIVEEGKWPFFYWNILQRWVHLFLQLLIKLTSLKGIFLFLPLLFFLRNVIKKNIFLFVLFYFTAYSFLLSVTYVTSFGEAEALRLASFDRYMTLPLFLVKLFVLIGILLVVIRFFQKRLIKFQRLSLVFLYFIVIGLFTQVLNKGASHTDRDYIEIYRTIEKATSLFIKNDDSVKFSVILNDSACEANFIAKYVSISNEKLRFDLNPTSIFSNTLNYNCVQQYTPENFIRWVKSINYALVIRESLEFKTGLQTYFPTCSEMTLPYVLIVDPIWLNSTCQKL